MRSPKVQRLSALGYVIETIEPTSKARMDALLAGMSEPTVLG
jgi:hypothetical protein